MNPENQQKKFYIIMGRSGCGKGTQAMLLKDYLEKESKLETLHITTGGNFREFLTQDNYSAEKSKEFINTGGLMPEFLAIWNWSNIFINKIKGKENIILDGAPRRMVEVHSLETALDFYQYKHATILYLNVSKGWAMEKLTSRAREDDNEVLEQEKKMAWFETEMLPCIESYKNNSNYKFIEINGEQSVELVHLELISKLNK